MASAYLSRIIFHSSTKMDLLVTTLHYLQPSTWTNSFSLPSMSFLYALSSGFCDSSVGKEYSCNAEDLGLISGLERSAGEGVGCPLQYSWASPTAQLVKNPPTMWETWVWENPLEKGEASHSSMLAWKIPWTVLFMGSQKVGHDCVTFTFTFHLAAFPYLVSPSSFSFSTSGIEPRSHTLQAHSLPSEPPGKPSASQPHLYSHWVLVTVDSKAVQGLEWVQYCRWVIVVLFKLGKSDLKLADQCIHIYIYIFFPTASIWHEELEDFFLVPTNFGHLQDLYLLPVFFPFSFFFSFLLPSFTSPFPSFLIALVFVVLVTYIE